MILSSHLARPAISTNLSLPEELIIEVIMKEITGYYRFAMPQTL